MDDPKSSYLVVVVVSLMIVFSVAWLLVLSEPAPDVITSSANISSTEQVVSP